MLSLRTTLARGGLVAALALGCHAWAGAAVAATPGEDAAKSAAVPAKAPHGAYAGTETCLTCHEERGAAIKQGAHSHAFRAGTPMAPKGCQACHGEEKAALGCEACHGPGKEHAEANGDKTKIKRFAGLSVKAASETCSSCHFRTRTRSGRAASTTSGTWGARPATASTRRRETKQLKAASQTELCADVPPGDRQQADAVQPHAGARGQARVLDCHNVHGSQNVKLLEVGDGQRVVRELPRREARTDAVGALAGDRELRHLPRPARFEQRSDAGGEAAVPLPALPRHVAAPSDGVRGLLLKNSTNATRSTAVRAWCATSRFMDPMPRRAKRSCGS